MGLFKRTKIQDERIESIRNKIYSEVYALIVTICVISIIMKVFFYHQHIENTGTEIVILLASSLYFIFRSANLGVFSAEVEAQDYKGHKTQQTKLLLIAIAIGVGIAIIFGLNSAIQYADSPSQSIYYFFLVAFTSLMIYLPFLILILVVGNNAVKRKNDKVIKQMLDDDSGDDDEKY